MICYYLNVQFQGQRVNIAHDHSGSVSSEICSLGGLTREADSVRMSGKAEARILGRNMSGGTTHSDAVLQSESFR